MLRLLILHNCIAPSRALPRPQLRLHVAPRSPRREQDARKPSGQHNFGLSSSLRALLRVRDEHGDAALHDWDSGLQQPSSCASEQLFGGLHSQCLARRVSDAQARAPAWQRMLDIASLHITLHTGAGRNEQQRNNATSRIRSLMHPFQRPVEPVANRGRCQGAPCISLQSVGWSHYQEEYEPVN